MFDYPGIEKGHKLVHAVNIKNILCLASKLWNKLRVHICCESNQIKLRETPEATHYCKSLKQFHAPSNATFC